MPESADIQELHPLSAGPPAPQGSSVDDDGYLQATNNRTAKKNVTDDESRGISPPLPPPEKTNILLKIAIGVLLLLLAGVITAFVWYYVDSQGKMADLKNKLEVSEGMCI